MGNLCSNDDLHTEDGDELASRDIERQLKEDEEKFKKISRLLLLGTIFFFNIAPNRMIFFRLNLNTHHKKKKIVSLTQLHISFTHTTKQ
jgi:hypothetical protein